MCIMGYTLKTFHNEANCLMFFAPAISAIAVITEMQYAPFNKDKFLILSASPLYALMSTSVSAITRNSSAIIPFAIFWHLYQSLSICQIKTYGPLFLHSSFP